MDNVPVAVNEPAERAPDVDDWKVTDPLPLLTRTLIRPVTDESAFNIESDRIQFPKEPTPFSGTEKPLDQDDAASTQAREWMETNFGDLPQGTGLTVNSISRDARYHLVSFHETIRGFPTDAIANVYVSANGRISAWVKLYSFEPVAGSARVVVDQNAAVNAWRDVFRRRPNAEQVLVRFNQKVHPRLIYAWSPKHWNGTDKPEVVAPTWVLDDEGLMMVDGHTGEPWFND